MEKLKNSPENYIKNNNEKYNRITVNELLSLKDECLAKIKAEQIYYIRNDAKLRAVSNTKSYDEFKDIVDAAHLRPLSKKDKMDATTKNRLWNSSAKDF